MTVVLLAGPPAVGHNTIADLLGTSHANLAVVDVDDVRAMARASIDGPVGGASWRRAYERSIRQSCMLARDFDRDRLDVILLDVAPPETLPRYRAELSGVRSLRTVLLLADPETLIERDRARHRDPDFGPLQSWHQRIRMLHHRLASATAAYDEVIDNGTAAAEDTAKRLLTLFR